MTEAEHLRDHPDGELLELLDELQRLSRTSESEARHDRECADGSTLTAISREGERCELTVTLPAPTPPAPAPAPQLWPR
jgi:hypothetical protein